MNNEVTKLADALAARDMPPTPKWGLSPRASCSVFTLTTEERDLIVAALRTFAARPSPVAWVASYKDQRFDFRTISEDRSQVESRLMMMFNFNANDSGWSVIPLYRFDRKEHWECMGRKQALPEPGDCGWPECGCDPHATAVIESLVEQGWSSRKPPRPEKDARNVAVLRQDNNNPDTYHVAAVNNNDGSYELATFSGTNAKERAIAFAGGAYYEAWADPSGLAGY